VWDWDRGAGGAKRPRSRRRRVGEVQEGVAPSCRGGPGV
jgi:hypothetical protein